MINELKTKELKVLIQVLNMPRTQNLELAQFCINLSDKVVKMLNATRPEKAEEKQQ